MHHRIISEWYYFFNLHSTLTDVCMTTKVQITLLVVLDGKLVACTRQQHVYCFYLAVQVNVEIGLSCRSLNPI